MPSQSQDGFGQPRSIAAREDDYRKRRLNRIISPERNDAFALGDQTPANNVRTYADVMRDQALQRERDNTLKNIADKRKAEEEEKEALADRDRPTKASIGAPPPPRPAALAPEPVGKKRNRWDQSGGDDAKKPRTDWEAAEATPAVSRWDATPGRTDATPAVSGSRWDATPTPGRLGGETPGPRKNRWDETPTPGPVSAPGVTMSSKSLQDILLVSADLKPGSCLWSFANVQRMPMSKLALHPDG